MDASNAQRIADLQREIERLQEDHERLTTQIIAKVGLSDRPAVLEAMTDGDIDELVKMVRDIGRHRDRRREIESAIRALAT